MNKFLNAIFVLILFFCYLSFAKPTFATILASQTTGYNDVLQVWQALQELGTNLSGPIGSFTFRIPTTYGNNQFNYTSTNTYIYDKTLNIVAAQGCSTIGDPSSPQRGLTFETQGVPSGFEDVVIDFSCRNAAFINGHRYLILISNANSYAQIQFAAVSYNQTATDYFTLGGLRYGNGNTYDWLHNSGFCDPIKYLWQDQTSNPVSGCNIWTNAHDDLYFKLSSLPPGQEPPVPFLELPWDYKSKGLSFTDAANRINSFFDHEYPLLSAPGLLEPEPARDTLTTFRGEFRTNFQYSSHDGYDYGRNAGANYNDPVLAAAAGCASYHKLAKLGNQSDGNNMIFIDHGNGYQTRYLHLQDDQYLITKSASCVQVAAGQRIGTIGFSGAVIPSGVAGAHIHFMVVQDKNHDGNFDDNIPDGVTDPFGWQSDQPDPWPAFIFNYGGQNRTGDKSYYLWKNQIDNLNQTLTSNGGVFSIPRYSINFPQGTTDQDVNLQMDARPNISIGKLLSSIGSALELRLKTDQGNIIRNLNNIITITTDFTGLDLSRFKLDTLSFYSSEDGINWNKEQTTVDLANHTATTQTNHASFYTLVAEPSDTIPASTSATLSGVQGQANWFRSDVITTLNSIDNPDGLGVDYLLYSLDNDPNWPQYLSPMTVSAEGHHELAFYSVDKADNIEASKSASFDIDKTPPEAKLHLDPNNQNLGGEGIDTNETDITPNGASIIVTDLAGNTATLNITRQTVNRGPISFNFDSLQYNQVPPTTLNSRLDETIGTFNKSPFIQEQDYYQNNNLVVQIKFDPRKNISTITNGLKGKKAISETRPGLTLLQLTTNQGNLEVSY